MTIFVEILEEMMQNNKTNILLLTGYLGSGKTTLVNHILRNEKGIRFAVIVNDIGEVNIDAEMIQREGVVNGQNDSLVSLQNGCICCTLQTDLMEQIMRLIEAKRFDYIVIEASGVCDPSPIAKTICSMPKLISNMSDYGDCRLDNIVTVVDALRMANEFGCGEDLQKETLGEDDIENLLVQQIEFCNTIVLNKVSEVEPRELNRIKDIIRALQPYARIIECDYAKVDLDEMLNTHQFDYAKVATSAGWIKELNGHGDEHDDDYDNDHDDDHDNDNDHDNDHDHDDEHEHDGHCHHHDGHCHCHHHHNENGETEEYGISSFVYYRRQPFDINRFDYFVNKPWPKNIIRVKGICYFNDDWSMSYLFEQAGQQKQLSKTGKWYATLSEQEIIEVMKQEPALMDDWDMTYGDRMIKLVVIGQHLDRKKVEEYLDQCLVAFGDVDG